MPFLICLSSALDHRCCRCIPTYTLHSKRSDLFFFLTEDNHIDQVDPIRQDTSSSQLEETQHSSHIMPTCPGCNVGRQFRTCTRTPKLCFDCCTTREGQLTCFSHFQQLGVASQELILSAASDDSVNEDEANVAQPAIGPEAPAVPAVPAVAVPAVPPPPIPGLAPAPISIQLQAQRDLQTQITALAEQVANIAALLSARVPAPAAEVPVPSPAVQLAAAEPIPIVSNSSSSLRQALLGVNPSNAAAIDELINRVQQRRRDEDEDAALESEVNSSGHNRHNIPSLSYASPATNTTLFPPSLAPTPIGSQQDSAQQITRLLLNMNKSAVKYPTLSDLASALDEWAALAVRAKWSSEQVLAIVRYRTFVIDEIGRKSSVTQAAKYHALMV